MSKRDMVRLREMLLKRRQEVFEWLRQFESDWQALGDRDIELEEEAQKADLTSLFDQLDERGKEGIEEIDLEELEISCRNGVVYLEGVVPSESEHSILLQILIDVMGFASIIDHLQITELIWEREDRAPDRASFPLSVDVDEISDDVFESQEQETPYIFPDRPPLEEKFCTSFILTSLNLIHHLFLKGCKECEPPNPVIDRIAANPAAKTVRCAMAGPAGGFAWETSHALGPKVKIATTATDESDNFVADLRIS